MLGDEAAVPFRRPRHRPQPGRRIVRETDATAQAHLVFPHPNYTRSYPEPARRESVPPGITISFFGTIKPYKGLEQLLRAFARIQNPGIRLVVAGYCKSDSYGRKVRNLVSQDSRIQLDLRFLPESELYRRFCQVDIVILPYQGNSLLTSGVAALCATLGVPFLAKDEAPFAEYRGIPAGSSSCRGTMISLPRCHGRSIGRAIPNL